MKPILGGLTALVVLALTSYHAAADEVFVLKGGGQVVGELLNPKEVPRETYVVKTSGGGQVTLARSQVKEVRHRRDVEVEYEKVRPGYADTVEGQWALAQWCRNNSMLTQSKVHLERILELDTDHEEARRALGYFRRDGQWITRKQLYEQEGKVLYRGRYRLPEEVQLLKEKEEVDAVEGEWMKNLKLRRGWLSNSKYSARAQASILNIDDPYAVKALVASLEDDRRQAARLLYLEALSRIGTREAKIALAVCAIGDPVPEVRLTCLDYLKKEKNPDAVKYFASKLRDKSNIKVNRGAVALEQMGDPSAVGPLIDALITAHKFKISTGNPGQMTTTFSKGGGGPSGLSMGGGPKIITRYFRNQAVLDALVSLSGGVSYGFDVRRWRAWYASQKKRQEFDARRE